MSGLFFIGTTATPRCVSKARQSRPRMSASADEATGRHGKEPTRSGKQPIHVAEKELMLPEKELDNRLLLYSFEDRKIPNGGSASPFSLYYDHQQDRNVCVECSSAQKH